MNPGRCRDCGGEILWVTRPDDENRWLPPFDPPTGEGAMIRHVCPAYAEPSNSTLIELAELRLQVSQYKERVELLRVERNGLRDANRVISTQLKLAKPKSKEQVIRDAKRLSVACRTCGADSFTWCSYVVKEGEEPRGLMPTLHSMRGRLADGGSVWHARVTGTGWVSEECVRPILVVDGRVIDGPCQHQTDPSLWSWEIKQAMAQQAAADPDRPRTFPVVA